MLQARRTSPDPITTRREIRHGIFRNLSTRSRLVLAGLVCMSCFWVFLTLVMILEPHINSSSWRGREIID
jgi:hypothetical protein